MNIDEHWTFQCLLSCVFPTCLVFDCFAAVHQSPFWFVKGRRVRKLLLLWCILYSYHVLPRSDVHFAASRPFFPPCQVRVVRFYVSCPAFRLPSAFLPPPVGPQLQARNRSGPRRTRTATSGSKCSHKNFWSRKPVRWNLGVWGFAGYLGTFLQDRRHDCHAEMRSVTWRAVPVNEALER